MINFETILRDCKNRYKVFEGHVDRKRTPRSFEKTILGASKKNPIIAEIKPCSPLGRNRVVEDPVAIANEMMKAGVCGISVLTEGKYFGGSLKNLQMVSSASQVPVLRKDFIFHVTQIPESYVFGADSLLLIAGFLPHAELKEFLSVSRELGMEPFVEVHSLKDIQKAKRADTQIYVINNRDKDTLEIDLRKSEKFSAYIDGLKISASGINTLSELRYVLDYCDAALIGNSIMRADDIEKKTREFVWNLAK
jgi:indole-3-glycerol phosphate synthase